MSRMHSYLSKLSLFDVHEHHMPGILLNREVSLLDLFRQSYAGWTQERPYPLLSESRSDDPMLVAAPETRWETLAPFLEHSGSNSFVRNLEAGICDLYEIEEGRITSSNWKELDRRVQLNHRNPEWVPSVLDRAGISRIVTDPYDDPLMDAAGSLGSRYHSVVRINSFAFGWHPDSKDHNGNSAHEFAERMGVELSGFDDYIKLMEKTVDSMKGLNQVALKNALAYDRDICFDEPDENLARNACGKSNPSPEERKAFGDYIVDRFCRLAGERDIPMQMHLGSALIRGSHPMNVAGLVERHPNTRFLLMHLAYPWTQDLFGMAFVLRNIWIDLTWSMLLSPSHFKSSLRQAIEILPDESRMMLGGDNWHAEETYSTFATSRKLIGEVLEGKVKEGYFEYQDAERLARKIFSENAEAFFGIGS